MGTVAQTPMLRWSSVRTCPRKAIYEATNAPRRERSEREERILWRGRSLGREYARFLKQKYGDENVLTEVQVRWPLGVGHMDAYLVPTRSAIEVLSSASASADMIHSKLLQLVGYMEHAPETLPVDAGALVVLDPSDFSDEIFPVAKTSKVYAGLVSEMRDRVAQVQAWAEQGTMPARVCVKPSEAIGRFCLHAEFCFEGWEAPELPALDDTETRVLVNRFYDLKRAERERSTLLGVVASERKEVEQRLQELVPVGKHAVGPLTITRTHVERSPTVDLKKAELAGYPVEALADYMKPGATYDTFRVDRVSDAPLDDFGDVPFHGDARDAA